MRRAHRSIISFGSIDVQLLQYIFFYLFFLLQLLYYSINYLIKFVYQNLFLFSVSDRQTESETVTI
jgi:hypothetical protein